MAALSSPYFNKIKTFETETKKSTYGSVREVRVSEGATIPMRMDP